MYINSESAGHAVWFTPPQQRDLYFVESLGIRSGKAYVPGMVWKATRNSLTVFAVKGKIKPLARTTLCHAPYFNMHSSGLVCMGNVRNDIERDACLYDFILQWERYSDGDKSISISLVRKPGFA